MDQNKPLYQTQAQYIRYLCDENGVNLKEVCKTLNINYFSIACNYRKKLIGSRKLYEIVKYLGGDMNIILALPTDRDLKKGASSVNE